MFRALLAFTLLSLASGVSAQDRSDWPETLRFGMIPV